MHRTREGLVVRTDVMPQVGRGWYADPDAVIDLTDGASPASADRPLRYWDGSRWAPPARRGDRWLVWTWYAVASLLPAVVLLLMPVLGATGVDHALLDRFLPAHIEGTARADELLHDVVAATAWTAVLVACWGVVLGGVMFAEIRLRCRTAARWYVAAWWIAAALIVLALALTVATPAIAAAL
ncbi:MAG: hypothetical protein LCI03_03950 [Actinobacteria bacterium]|nr:hypothetical protein [Actinomycetota bacterium]